MRRATTIVDAQVHAYMANTASRPWNGRGHGGPPDASALLTLAAMDDAGVDGAIAVSSWTVYGNDPTYSLEAASQFPDRFRVVVHPDPHSSRIAEYVSDCARNTHICGSRIAFATNDQVAEFEVGCYDSYLNAAQRYSLPLCVAGSHCFTQIERLATRFPELQIVVDHLALFPPVDSLRPFAKLSNVVSLARFPNVAVKCTGLPSLSREFFPYRDIWVPLFKVISAFGPGRCMWGTDWTRSIDKVSYGEGVQYMYETDELSHVEFAEVMGGTAQQIFGWSPNKV
jgi:L-fuconolactonase